VIPILIVARSLSHSVQFTERYFEIYHEEGEKDVDGACLGKDIFNPDIVAADGSVYVVGENADGNIVCLYSSDEGDSFQESTVSDDVNPETFPQITIASGTLICAYTRDGDLYSKESNDGGVTWINEVKINDPSGTAVEQYGCSGIDGPYASWTDNRNAPPTEIYFDETIDLGNPPGAPTIDGPATGKPGQSLTYTFSAVDPDGDDVRFIVDWGDGSSDTTDYVASGDSKTESHTWGSEATYTITATAQDSAGNMGASTTFQVIIPRNKDVHIHPFLRFLQNHPKMFPILRTLLGL